MNSKWSMAVVCVGLTVVAARAPAQERVTEVSAKELATQQPLDYGGVAAFDTAKMMTYQGFAEKAGVAINNQSMVVELRAYPTPTGGSQQGTTVLRTLTPAEVYKGSFAFDFDASLLALPDNADETYLEVALCSPAPCTAVPLDPRKLATHSALAMSARELGNAASFGPNGALVVESAASGSGEISLKNQSATATMSLKAGDGVIAASRNVGAAPLQLTSNSTDGSFTYMRVDNAAKEFAFGAEDFAAETAGITPPVCKLQLSQTGVAMSASVGASPANLSFMYSGQAAMMVSEDPEVPGQAIMMVAPPGVLFSTEPLAASQDATAAPPNRYRVSAKAVASDSAQGNVALVGSALEFASVSGAVVTPLMAINGDTGEASFYGSKVRANLLQVGPTAVAANTAGVTPLFATLEYVPPTATTAGPTPAAELQLKVNNGIQDFVVARWTGRSGVPAAEQFEHAPNYIGGRFDNYIADGVVGATIVNGGSGFGFVNRASNPYLCPSPPCSNYCPTGTPCWEGNNRALNSNAGIVAGYGNEVQQGCFIGGGRLNQAGVAPTDADSVIAGGRNNTVDGSLGAIVGGEANVAGQLGFVGAGFQNNGGCNGCVVTGGYYNGTLGASFNTIAGGINNTTRKTGSTVSGGEGNTASGAWSTVPGGERNTAGGDHSFAAGLGARVRDSDPASPYYSGDAEGDKGTFMWADWSAGSANPDFISDGDNKFLVRAAGGTTFYSNSALTAGVTLAAGGGSWSSVSDKNLKENFADIDKEALLEKLSAIPVTTWNYKSQDSSIRHIGPMGQDFHSAFGVGETETRLSTIDVDGVALAAIQGLHELVKEKDCELAELREKMERLEAMFNALTSQNAGGTR